METRVSKKSFIKGIIVFWKNQCIVSIAVMLLLLAVALPSHALCPGYIDDIVMKINELVVIVDELNLHMGINNNLDAKLSTSIKALDDIKEHNDVAALHSMEAFAQAVEVQRDKFISDALPDMLIEKANEIILWLEWHTGDDVTCPICGGNPCVPPCPCS